MIGYLVGIATLTATGFVYLEQVKIRKSLDSSTPTDSPKKKIPDLAIIPYYKSYPHLGSDIAPVKMIAFVDYECPYSLAFIRNQLPRLKASFINENILKIYFYDLPLKQHSKAEALSLKAHSSSGDQMFTAFLEHLSVEGSLLNLRSDTASNHDIKRRIEHSKEIAGIAGIISTPSFVINNRVLVGLRDFEEMESLIRYSESNTIKEKPQKNSCN